VTDAWMQLMDHLTGRADHTAAIPSGEDSGRSDGSSGASTQVAQEASTAEGVGDIGSMKNDGKGDGSEGAVGAKAEAHAGVMVSEVEFAAGPNGGVVVRRAEQSAAPTLPPLPPFK